MDVHMWEHICNCRCVIDLKNKPFGSVLPIETQNMIVVMSWEMTHRDKYAKVMKELLSLLVCALTDWVGYPAPGKRFGTWYKGSWCFACSKHNCLEHSGKCRWCELYKMDKESLDIKLMEHALLQQRNALSNYDEEGWQRYVRENIQQYSMKCLL